MSVLVVVRGLAERGAGTAKRGPGVPLARAGFVDVCEPC